MPRAQAFIPLSKGLDQRLDERLREADSLQQVTNGYYRRGNALSKRFGFTRMTTLVQTGDASTLAEFGTPKGMFSSGDELCVRGARELYTYKPATDSVAAGWITRGKLSPFTGRQRNLFSDARTVTTCDMAQVGSASSGVIGHVESATNGNNTATDETVSLVFSAERTTGEVLLNKFVLASTTAAVVDGEYSQPRVVNSEEAGNPALFISHQGPPSGGAAYDTLTFWRYDATIPFTQPVIGWLHNDLYRGGSVNRAHDSAPTANGEWSYCYLKAVTGPTGAPVVSIHVNRRLGSVQQAAVDIAAPAGYANWLSCSLHYGAISGQLYVTGHAITAGGIIGVFVTALNASTLTTIWGPTLVDANTLTATTNETCLHVSVCEGSDQNGTVRVVCAWTEEREDGSGPLLVGQYPNCRRIGSRSFTIAGVASSLVQHQPNCELAAKPFFKDNRVYAPARSYWVNAVAFTVERSGYSCDGVLDLGFGDGSDRRPFLCGRFNFGASAAHVYWGRSYGSLNTSQLSGNVARYAALRVINLLGDGNDGASLGADEIELDFDGQVTQSATTRGTATIGGGNVSWYAGATVEELGWSASPYVYYLEPGVHASGTLPAGTYTYVPTWESYDEKGTLTRSLPGPAQTVQITGGGGTNSVSVWVLSQGLTQRYNERRFRWALYRAGADGVFYRCSEPAHLMNDSEGLTNFPVNFVDRGKQFDVLYTQGGAELEAVGPDGAAFAVTTSKRVWLAGFYKRDRVMYSKPYDPTTANEYALAPEFNDAFSYLLPGGEPCTGLVEMDDKVVVFTRGNIYAIAGNGPDDGGRGNDFSGLQLVASDAGCIDARSIVASPIGAFFQSQAGLFVLGRDLQLTYIGAAVRDATETYSECTSATLVPSHNHVRFTMRSGAGESVILTYDLDQTAWLQWQPKKPNGGGEPVSLDIVGACLHDGTYYVLEADGSVYFEDESTHYDYDGTVFVSLAIQTGWLQIAQQSGYQRVRKVAAMCKSNDPHALTMQVRQDFENVYSQAYTWSAADVANMQLDELVELHVKKQKSTAFQLVIFDSEAPGSVTGQGFECAGFAVELQGKRGLYKAGTQQRN